MQLKELLFAIQERITQKGALKKKAENGDLGV
jgi:hypothetical protein